MAHHPGSISPLAIDMRLQLAFPALKRLEGLVHPAVFRREDALIAEFAAREPRGIAVVEAAILVSRLDLLPREKIEAEMAFLATAVEKTAGPQEQEAWGWLVEKVRAHAAR